MAPASTLNVSRDKGALRLETGTGWTLAGEAAIIRSARGELLGSARAPRRGPLAHALEVRRLSGQAVELRQTLRNGSGTDLAVGEIVMLDGRLELEGAGWRVAHTELFQAERYFDGYSYFTGGLLAPLPGAEGTFGLSENLPFPGILFLHPERGAVLMAVLSQERCKPCWTLRGSGRRLNVTAEERFSGVPHVRVKPGQTLESERWVVLCARDGMEAALETYYRLLRQRLTFTGTESILRQAVVWGSWNYNYRPRGHMDVTHDVVAANARALKRLVPGKPRVVMIDDGYQRGSLQGGTRGWFASCLEIFHPDGQPPHDPALFPRGMKAAADAIRKGGALPAIWTTPRVHRESSLARAHPDWLLRPAGRAAFGRRTAYLDYSVPEARDYTRQAWHTYREWGYRGIKLDFWSLPFEIPEVRYRHGDRTAIQLRNQFLEDLRAAIPPDGYLITGCVVNNGNPFVGRYADAVRAGQDIGDGAWPNILPSAMCLTSTAPFFRHDALLADADSIGWCPRATPDENRLWATLAFMTGAVCEVGGDLTRLTPEARGLLQTVTRLFQPARRTRTDLLDGGLAAQPASRLVLERDDGVFEARLNWRWFSQEVAVPRGARDVWTGRRLGGVCRIPPHGAILWRHS